MCSERSSRTAKLSLWAGECGDDGVVRPNDPPGAGRVRPILASKFPLRERCKEVGNIGRVSVVKRKTVRVAIKDATKDGLVFLGWEGNLSSGDSNSGVRDLIPTFSISGPCGKIFRIKLHRWRERAVSRPVMGTDLNGRGHKTGTEKDDKKLSKRS